ncbi:mechanosensitive ion channel family protein [Wolinella succinogenes]|uniref:mechanosensitive ion channel family protein n=1 Tax=Wolinella succinogenes TaxID=844 RepID=UPI002408F6BD|nr:mechanosensitive ion channel family protein [Wolinella succinogenes]
MFRLLASLLLSLLLFPPLSLRAQEDTVDLFLIIQRIQTINEQLQVAKSRNLETNESAFSKEFQGVIERKLSLLEKIPMLLVSHQESLRPQERNFQKEESELAIKIKTNDQMGYKKAVWRDKILLETIRADRLFLAILEDLEQKLKGFTSPHEIQTRLDESILALQSLPLEELKKVLKEGGESPIDLEISQNLERLEGSLSTYLEVLEYLRANSALLVPNYLFSSLNLKGAIDFLNSKIPLSLWNLNLGKLLISGLILILFWSLRRLLAKGTFYLFVTLPTQMEQDASTKSHIITTITKPLSLLLFFYGFDVCLNVFYYPSPVPMLFSKWFGVLYIILFSWFSISVLEGYGTLWLTSLAKKNRDLFRKEVVNLALKILYFIVILIALLMILSRLGFDISALVASLGIGGLAVALAAKDILANFFASVMLLFDNSFSQGDWIECGGVEGTVVEIGLRRTTIRTFDNAMLFVPNSKLANESIRNWNRRQIGRRIKMRVGVTYDSPKEKLEACVREIRAMLLVHPGIAKAEGESLERHHSLALKRDIVSIDDLLGLKSNLLVYVDSFAPSSIDILIYCFSRSTVWAEWLAIKENIILQIMEIIERHGLKFAFPSQSLYIESIPSDALERLKEPRHD